MVKKLIPSEDIADKITFYEELQRHEEWPQLRLIEKPSLDLETGTSTL